MLPEKYAERMKKLLGADFDAYAESLSYDREQAFHINRIKFDGPDISKLLPFDTEKIPYCDGGYYFSADKPGNHPLHHAGMFYIQEPSAMAPIACLDGRLPENVKILDVCASPGGKSSQAASLANSLGVIVSNEIVPSRCKTLVGNMERLGLRNSIVTNCDSKKLSEIFGSSFGLVICDTPCSGEGMFRKSEQAVSEWSEENVTMCAERQREILTNAARCVTEGGYLLYSTCTFSTEENEENVSWFLKTHDDFEICYPGERFESLTSPGVSEYCIGFEPSYVRRCYPHITRGEGQFFSLFRKKGIYNDTEFSFADASRKLTKDESKAASEFLKETVGCDDFPLRASGNNIFILDKNIPVPKNHVFSCGVKLGEYKSSRIIPHHQFFSAYGTDFIKKTELSADSPECMKYLHGEGFNVEKNSGWTAVSVCGIPLGGGKIVDSYLKNHYPKGLRII